MRVHCLVFLHVNNIKKTAFEMNKDQYINTDTKKYRFFTYSWSEDSVNSVTFQICLIVQCKNI